MANLSDAFGTIIVEKVGHDLVEFLKEVQKDAYYLLVDDLDNLKPDSDGDVEFSFGVAGRWNYGSNIEGYLQGQWMNSDKEKEAYDKFIKVIKEKKGMITLQYQDCDPAMDWMGKGVFVMDATGDDIEFRDQWDEQELTIANYAEMNEEDEYWAMQYIYGDDITNKYDAYVDECRDANKEPETPSVWFDTIYKED